MPTNIPIAIIGIRVDIQNGSIYVHSDDVPGLHLCGDNMESLATDTIDAIRILYKKNKGIDVIVKPAADPVTFEENTRLETNKRYIAYPQELTA